MSVATTTTIRSNVASSRSLNGRTRTGLAMTLASTRTQLPIGVAQEYAKVFSAIRRDGDGPVPWFSFSKTDRRVTRYYFYFWNSDFGAAFVKVCCYVPTR